MYRVNARKAPNALLTSVLGKDKKSELMLMRRATASI